MGGPGRIDFELRVVTPGKGGWDRAPGQNEFEYHSKAVTPDQGRYTETR